MFTNGEYYKKKKLKKFSKGNKIMTKTQIKEFIMHYERITRNMIKNLSSSANIVVNIDKQHCLNSMKYN